MKRCPKCGWAGTDADVFCEEDGDRLVASAGEAAPEAATLRAPSRTCPSCGLLDADEGDGYCSACGLRLASPVAEPRLAVGTKIDGFTVTRALGPDEFVARDAAGADCVIVLGEAEALSQEGAALTRLGGASPFPRALKQVAAGEQGPSMLLSAPLEGARPLGDVAGSLAVGAALALLRLVADAASRVEKQGFTWEPADTDVFVRDDGGLVLARLRGARRLGKEQRLDARAAVARVASALLPEPAVRGSPSLVRLCSRGANAATPQTIEEIRDELSRLEGALTPPAEGFPGLSELVDPGMKRGHNEDATAIAAGVTHGEPWAVLVVCDGVSSSTHAEQASTIAATTTRDALAHFARSGDIIHEGAQSAMTAAIRAAHVAVCATRIEHGATAPPGTTLVAALIHRRRITVGWVGDSRAYWVSPSGSELLTRDHSWVEETVARGEMTELEAMNAPLAHALTKCLGPLEVGDEKIAPIDPDVRVRPLPGTGHLVLCTDGLWNYFPGAPDIAELVQATGRGANTAAIARFLVNSALACGGGDNVSVAVYEHK